MRVRKFAGVRALSDTRVLTLVTTRALDAAHARLPLRVAAPRLPASRAASGAYIFRVNSTSGGTIFPVAPGGGPVSITTATGAVVNEARLVFSPWATAVFRLWKGVSTVDVEYTIGAIPIADQWGKEVRAGFCDCNSSRHHHAN